MTTFGLCRYFFICVYMFTREYSVRLFVCLSVCIYVCVCTFVGRGIYSFDVSVMN